MYYITTSRPYANATPHLGTIMDQIYGDCLQRFHVRLGNSLFTAGMDEHGLKILRTSESLGIQPKKFVDERYQEYKNLYQKLNISPQVFGQTTEPKHYWVANAAWQKLEQKGLIYQKDYIGEYCVGCEDFYTENQLVNKKCPIHPHLELEHIEESNYFFKISAFKDILLEFLDRVYIPDKSIAGEMKNIVKDLHDISISRPKERLSWGIPVDTHEDSVMYVWFEALLSYISSIVSDDLFETWNAAPEEVQITTQAQMWEDVAEVFPVDCMIMGRDNAKFHLIIWPALLAGLDLPLPQSALIHGMITDDQGRKFAKSLGNGVELNTFVETVGIAGTRFYILHETNQIGDSQFSLNHMVQQYNSAMSGNIGNLLVRVTNLIEKNLDGIIEIEEGTESLVKFDDVYSNLNKLLISASFKELLLQATRINQYLEETKPWELAKDKEAHMTKIRSVLTIAAKSLLEVGEVLSIFLPEEGAQFVEILQEDIITKAPSIFPKIELTEIN